MMLRHVIKRLLNFQYLYVPHIGRGPLIFTRRRLACNDKNLLILLLSSIHRPHSVHAVSKFCVIVNYLSVPVAST